MSFACEDLGPTAAFRQERPSGKGCRQVDIIQGSGEKPTASSQVLGTRKHQSIVHQIMLYMPIDPVHGSKIGLTAATHYGSAMSFNYTKPSNDYIRKTVLAKLRSIPEGRWDQKHEAMVTDC